MMRRTTLALAAALCLAATAGQASEAAKDLSIHLRDGRLSLKADDAPLREVLEAVGRAGDFTVEVRGHVSGSVSPSIRAQPLQAAIARLLAPSPHSFFLRFAKSDGGPARLARLVVIGADPAPASAVAAPAATTEAVAEVRDVEREEAVTLLEAMLQQSDPALQEAAAEAMADLESLRVVPSD